MQNSFTPLKEITKEIVQQFVNIQISGMANTSDVSEMYQCCKQLGYTALKRLTSICILSGDCSVYLHLKSNTEDYMKIYEILGDEKWTTMHSNQ